MNTNDEIHVVNKLCTQQIANAIVCVFWVVVFMSLANH